MERVEQVGIIVVVISCVVAMCNRYMTPMLLPVVVLVLFVGISNNLTHASFISARKARQPVKPSEKTLPQTTNKRHKKVNADSDTTKDDIKGSAKEEENEDKEKDPPPPPPGRMDIFQYTPQGMQARLDERQFRYIPTSQPQEARVRMLNSMYQELLDASMKGDPGLRRKGDEHGCEPIRGRTKPHML